jgi:hypothetical protein
LECKYPGQIHSAPSKDYRSSSISNIPSNDLNPSLERVRTINSDGGPSSCPPANELHPVRSLISSPRPNPFPGSSFNIATATIYSNADMLHPFEISNIELTRPPESSPETKIVEFLSFHHEFVIPSHYFWYHDNRGFCSRGLLDLASNSSSMRYAVAAYAALLYSVFKHDRKAREYAFLYYAQSMFCIKAFVNAPSKKLTLSVLATILELTSFEVCYPLFVRSDKSA